MRNPNRGNPLNSSIDYSDPLSLINDQHTSAVVHKSGGGGGGGIMSIGGCASKRGR